MSYEQDKKLLFDKFGENRIDIIIPVENGLIASVDGEDQPSFVCDGVIRGLNENDSKDARLLSAAFEKKKSGDFY